MTRIIEGDRRINIPDPKANPVGEAVVFYSVYYEKYNDDSDPKSRRTLMDRAYPHLRSFDNKDWVLDLGAGKQIFEAEYTQRYGKPDYHIVALDAAKINSADILRAPSFTAFPHIQGSGSHLPFIEVFSLVVTNMALDFMPKEAITELYRVLKPGSHAFVNLHHPSLIPEDLNHLIARINRKLANTATSRRTAYRARLAMERAVLEHKKYLKDERILYENEQEIQTAFEERGFIVERVDLAGSASADRWWEADLRKP